MRIQPIVSHTRVVSGILLLASKDRQCVITDIKLETGLILKVDLLPIMCPRDSQLRNFPTIGDCFACQDNISTCIDFLVLWAIINEGAFWKLVNAYEMNMSPVEEKTQWRLYYHWFRLIVCGPIVSEAIHMHSKVRIKIQKKMFMYSNVLLSPIRSLLWSHAGNIANISCKMTPQ